MPTNTRLSGHWLVAEGAPHDGRGRRIGHLYSGSSGVGRAKCGCGALSEVLDSATQRRQWGKDHKEDIRSGAVGSRAPKRGRFYAFVGVLPEGPLHLIAGSAEGDTTKAAEADVERSINLWLEDNALAPGEVAFVVEQIRVVAEGSL